MKYSIKIIFGKEQVDKYLSDIPLASDEKEIHEKEYFFKTKPELEAFLKGVDETVGWSEYCQVENKNSIVPL